MCAQGTRFVFVFSSLERLLEIFFSFFFFLAVSFVAGFQGQSPLSAPTTKHPAKLVS